MMKSVCYCKECKQKKFIKWFVIDEKDRMELELACGHRRVYQLITSSEDYK